MARLVFPKFKVRLLDGTEVSAESTGGITLQEYYYGVVMQGLLAQADADTDPELLATEAWDIAAVMVRGLSEE